MKDVHALAHDAVMHHGAMQKVPELEELGLLLLDQDVRSIVELGTYAGGTAWFFAELGFDVTAVDIDMSHRSRLNEHPRIHWVLDYTDRYALKSPDVDVVFVDDGRKFPEIQRSWEAWREKARIVVFHHIAQGLLPPLVDVWQVWWQIRERYPTLEMVADDGYPPTGMGVVWL